MNSQKIDQLRNETEKLKQEINLVNFSSLFDYSIVKAKNSNSNINRNKFVMLENKANDKILVSLKPTGHWVYQNTDVPGDKGSIFDFLKNRLPDFTMAKAKEYIYANSNALPPSITSKPASFATAEDVRNQMEAIYKNLENKPHTLFLKSRGIDATPFFQEASKGKIFSEQYTSQANNTYENTVFPLHSFTQEGSTLAGFERRNPNYKGLVEDTGKSFSCWESNVIDNTKPVGNYIISESPVDAISFAELHPQVANIEDNSVLASTIGNAADGQLAQLSLRISQVNASGVHLANDNDCSGQYFNTRILCNLPASNLVEPEYRENMPGLVMCDLKVSRNKVEGMLEWTFKNSVFVDDKFNEKNILAFNQVNEFYKELNKEVLEVLSDKPDTFKVQSVYNKDDAKILVSFKNSKACWEEINKSILFLKYNDSEKVVIHKAQAKDFNQDLMVKKGLKEIVKADVKEKKTKGLKM